MNSFTEENYLKAIYKLTEQDAGEIQHRIEATGERLLPRGPAASRAEDHTRIDPRDRRQQRCGGGVHRQREVATR